MAIIAAQGHIQHLKKAAEPEKSLSFSLNESVKNE